MVANYKAELPTANTRDAMPNEVDTGAGHEQVGKRNQQVGSA